MSSKRNSRDHLFVRTQSQRTKRASQFSAIFGQVIHSRSHSFVLNVIQFTLSTRWNRRTCFIGSSTAAFRSAAEANNKLDITIRMCRDAHTTLRPSKTTRIWIVCKVWCVCVWRQALICWAFYSPRRSYYLLVYSLSPLLLSSLMPPPLYDCHHLSLLSSCHCEQSTLSVVALHSNQIRIRMYDVHTTLRYLFVSR